MLYVVSYYDWDCSSHKILYSEKEYNEDEFKELCDKVYDETYNIMKENNDNRHCYIGDVYERMIERLVDEYGFKGEKLLNYELGNSRRVVMTDYL